MPITAACDEQRIIAFFAYLQDERDYFATSMSVIASAKIGAAVQGYIKFKSMVCEYATIAKTVGSLVAAARFVHAVRKARVGAHAAPSSAPIDELVALHTQCLSLGRQQSKFSTAIPPKAWLDWEACQLARLSAEKTLSNYRGSSAAKQLNLSRTACLLKLLTAMPPDRVGVYRLLQLGSSLKANDDGFQMDLSEPGAHKTAAIFGPTRTTITPSVAERITHLIAADTLAVGEYLFHGADRRSPLASAAWTRLVKAAFKTHSGVALCPKVSRLTSLSSARLTPA